MQERSGACTYVMALWYSTVQHTSLTILLSYYPLKLDPLCTFSGYDFPPQGYTSRSCVWDGEQLVLPSDSGKLVWWSTSGERLFEAAVDVPGYVVHMQWSLSGRAVWMCGFSRLSYVEIDRNSDGS